MNKRQCWCKRSATNKPIESFCIPNSLLADPPLDSRREPCDAEFAGRDQIG